MHSVSSYTTEGDCLWMYQDLSGKSNTWKADIRRHPLQMHSGVYE